ncbi:MAG: hypothetical protein JWO91_297 [Acidobacteriaceae bacterium]|nr:hypothetical protein [Acidobacteriaceae bacterium]
MLLASPVTVVVPFVVHPVIPPRADALLNWSYVVDPPATDDPAIDWQLCGVPAHPRAGEL